jgi:hypothetical protein
MAGKNRGKDDGKSGDRKGGQGRGRPADDEEQNLLEDWQRLNPDPPHVGPVKKKPAPKKSDET